MDKFYRVIAIDKNGDYVDEREMVPEKGLLTRINLYLDNPEVATVHVTKEVE